MNRSMPPTEAKTMADTGTWGGLVCGVASSTW